MTLEVIDNHSIRPDLLSKGVVLDAGARGFRFAKELAWRGCHVIALEPDDEVQHPKYINVTLRREAIWSGPGQKSAWLEMTADPEARYIVHDPACPGTTLRRLVTAWPLDYFAGLYVKPGTQWDLVKLNVEGEEYDILAAWPGPVAKQITVSFHEHTSRKRGTEAIDAIVKHLEKWYRAERHVWESKYCAGLNYWDSLFVLKELA